MSDLNLKNLVIVGNCYSHEIKRLLLSNSEFLKYYKVDVFFNYLNAPDQVYIDAIKNADCVICQNVKSIPEYSPSFVASHIRSDSLLYKFEFFRFDGFWPVRSPLERLSSWFWFPVDEFGDDISYNDYINMDLDRALISSHFERSIDRLRRMDEGMDYKPFNFFEKIWNHFPTYSDYWHPTPILFAPLVSDVLRLLNISNLDVDQVGDSLININRRRLILNSVGYSLGLKYDFLSKFKFFEFVISPEEYYYFAKYLKSHDFLPRLDGMACLNNKLKTFLGAE